MVLCDGRRLYLRSRTRADAVNTRRFPARTAEGTARVGVRRRHARKDTHWLPTCRQDGDLLSRGGKELRLPGGREAVPCLRYGDCRPTALAGVGSASTPLAATPMSSDTLPSILAVNSGSSSLKLTLFALDEALPRRATAVIGR